MKIPVPGGNLEIPETEGLADWPYWRDVFLKRPAVSWAHRTASFDEALTRMRELGVTSLVEACGGLGVFSWMAQRALELSRHVAIDISMESVDVIRRVCPEAEAVCGNAATAVQLYVTPDDAVFLDYPVFTLLKTKDLAPSWEMAVFDQIFKYLRPSMVLVTDTAASRFHLNRGIYERRFGAPLQEVEDYYRLYERRTGYALDSAWRFSTIGGGGTLILLTRERQMNSASLALQKKQTTPVTAETQAATPEDQAKETQVGEAVKKKRVRAPRKKVAASRVRKAAAAPKTPRAKRSSAIPDVSDLKSVVVSADTKTRNLVLTFDTGYVVRLVPQGGDKASKIKVRDLLAAWLSKKL